MPWGTAQICGWDPRHIRYENWIDTSDILHTRKAIQRLGGWDEGCRIGADWNLMQRVAMADMKVVNVPEVLTKYYWHGNNQAGRQAMGQPAIWSMTYNRIYDVQRSFSSLWNLTQGPYLHYVLDQGSTDGTVDWLSDMYREGRIHYLRLSPTNIGISRGSNELLDVIMPGDYHSWIVKFDSDIIVQTPRWLERLIKRCPEKAAISPHVLGLIQHPGGAPRTSRDAKKRLGYVKHLGGAVNAAPTAAWKDFGRWVVPAPAHGLQDTEFSNRLKDKGWKLCHAEDILVRHIRNVDHTAERRLVV
jgi:GT2 family glycosyltransferase